MVKYTGTNEEWNKNWQSRKEAFILIGQKKSLKIKFN